ncbi:MAG: hypothetical protein GY856_27010 [bacterium]|nr:hypothetical protein [bacterium]
MNTRVFLFALVLLITAFPSTVRAQLDDEGLQPLQFFFSPPGTAATGMGGAFIGLANDASAAVINPAGLPDLERKEVAIEYRGREQTVDPLADQLSLLTLEPTESGERVNSVSLVSLALPFGKWSLGAFYHESLRFENSFELERRLLPASYMDIDAAVGTTDLRVSEMGLAGAFRTGRLRWGIAARWVTMELNSSITRPQPPAGLFRAKYSQIDDSQSGLGGTLGLRLPVTAKLDLGAVVNINPSFEFDPYVVDIDYGPYGVFSSEFDPILALPNDAGIGAAYRPAERWTVVADVRWLELSRVYEESVLIDTNNYVYLSEDRFSMDDRFEFRSGVEYALPVKGGRLALRAGYFLVPERRLRFDPPEYEENELHPFERGRALDALYNSQPEDTLHGFSAGVEWRFNDHFDLAVAYSTLGDVLDRFGVSMELRY